MFKSRTTVMTEEREEEQESETARARGEKKILRTEREGKKAMNQSCREQTEREREISVWRRSTEPHVPGKERDINTHPLTAYWKSLSSPNYCSLHPCPDSCKWWQIESFVTWGDENHLKLSLKGLWGTTVWMSLQRSPKLGLMYGFSTAAVVSHCGPSQKREVGFFSSNFWKITIHLFYLFTYFCDTLICVAEINDIRLYFFKTLCSPALCKI